MKERGEMIFSADERKELAYAPDFKELLFSNKGKQMFSTFRKLVSQIENGDSGTTAEENGLQLQIRGGSSEGGFLFLKADYGGQEFFVKIEERRREGATGVTDHNVINEAQSLIEAAALLRDIPWVELEEFQMAYRDAERGYFVGKWLNLPLLQEYTIEGYGDHYSSDMEVLLEGRLRILRERLLGYEDFSGANAFYDEARDKIVLFDLHKARGQE